MTDFNLTASSFDTLNAAIAQADADSTTGDTYTITFTASITETADPTAFNLHSGVSVTLDGADYDLDGASTYRGLFVYAGTVTIENLTIQNAHAVGGGAGRGGGLYVAGPTQGAGGSNVTLSGVTFTDDSAAGGAGADGSGGAGGATVGGGAGGAPDGGAGGFGGGGGAGAIAVNGGNGGFGGGGVVGGAVAGLGLGNGALRSGHRRVHPAGCAQAMTARAGKPPTLRRSREYRRQQRYPGDLLRLVNPRVAGPSRSMEDGRRWVARR
jgi:hypothetical protein